MRTAIEISRAAQRYAPVKHEFFPFTGGLDVVTPPLVVKPGFLREALNFEANVNGGYTLVKGYERFSGQPKPSFATYSILRALLFANIAVGATITGENSAATAVVIAVVTGEESYLAITKVSGIFDPAGEPLAIAGATVGVATSGALRGAAPTVKLDAQYLNLAADRYRADITAVPGSGPVQGVWSYQDVVYAFRANAAGTATAMWASSPTGWSPVSLPVTLLPGGRYEFENHNFSGAAALKMYGVDGVNPGFEFDGTTYVPISTGMVPDAPKFLKIHKKHLFYAFGASLQHSAIGDPLSWTITTGAAELGIGDTITGISSEPGSDLGGALLIASRNRLGVLYGSSSADWNLVNYSVEAGAFPYSLQHLPQALMLDDRGITALTTTASFGNFEQATLSRLIHPWLIDRKSRIQASCVVREKNQYRLFFNDKNALFVTMAGRKVLGILPVLTEHEVHVIASNEFSDGAERVFFGGANGFVYQMDSGTSFDGLDIQFLLSLHFFHSSSPRTLKRYRHAALEVSGGGYCEFNFSYELGYAAAEYPSDPSQLGTPEFGDADWDTGVWDAGVWDGRSLLPAQFDLAGSAENIALRIFGNSDYFSQITFNGVMLHTTPRRGLR